MNYCEIIGVFVLHLLCICVSNAQVDSSAKSFFPASVDNSWRYQYTQTAGYITTLTRDSIFSGSRYIFFDNSKLPSYKIDSSMNVIAYPNQGSYEELRYKLGAQKNEGWIIKSRDGLRIVARVDDIFWGFVLGIPTQIKKIGYYYQPYPDTSSYSLWRNSDYIAAGFGLYLEIADALVTPAKELYGCVINGKTYGVMTEMKKGGEHPIPSIFSLYPASPYKRLVPFQQQAKGFHPKRNNSTTRCNSRFRSIR